MDSSASIGSSFDDDFPPEPRGRCYTWPMQQYVQYEPTIPESTDVSPSASRDLTVAQLLAQTPSGSTTQINGSSQMLNHLQSPQQQQQLPMLPHQQQCQQQIPELGRMGGMNGNPGMMPGMPPEASVLPPAKKKRCRRKPADQLVQKKPNPWGEESYSDIIARALESAPDGRLKLNEIYQWFSDNIPYFHERSSQEEAAGWKNSIRHNLSLHSRFMRIQNEGAGKSSWWVINPDAKPGRNPRRTRAATIDSTTKAKLEKGRRGARKKVAEMRMGLPLHSGVSSLAGSQASIMSHDIYGEEDTFDPFRPRTQSTLSMPGSSTRVSPSMDHTMVDDFDFPPWVDAATAIQPGIPSDIVDRTDQMRLDACRGLMNGIIKQEPKVIKQEPTTPMYHELNSVRGGAQMQNPLLRGTQIGKFPPGYGIPPMYSAYGTPPPPPPTSGPMGWPGSPVTTLTSMPSCGAQQFVGLTSSNALSASSALLGAASSALPMDLENLTLPDAPLMEMDVESLLRHELSQTRDHQINFDI